MLGEVSGTHVVVGSTFSSCESQVGQDLAEQRIRSWAIDLWGCLQFDVRYMLCQGGCACFSGCTNTHPIHKLAGIRLLSVGR